ncbi:MAG: hypothetical protein H7Y31_14835 [Chitinophagaceae bacterium]|nr:hypothetical protein [Chitinophagaceae bacterium]
MKKANFIRKTIGGFLLLLFLLSATPKSVLHDLFSNHADWKATQIAASNTVTQNLNAFTCKCDNLFAQPVLVVFDNELTLVSHVHIASYQFTALPISVSVEYLRRDFRGPPTA